MNDSMAQPRGGFASLEAPGWKSALSWLGAVLLSLLFVTSGVWKIASPAAWAVRIAELKFPQSLSTAAALVFGVAETVGAVLILVPRFRRWGAMLIGILLVGFMGYFAVNYGTLHGAECGCFPWVKRVVGPEFFIGDGLMLVLACFAGIWSKPPESLRTAFVILGAVVVFALVSYGVEAVRQTGTKAPDSITVNGQPYSIQEGKVFLFFFNPQCTHCFDAARTMSQFQWGSTRVVAVPVEQPQWAAGFLQETGLKAVVTSDFPTLKTTFGYTAYPFGVAIEDGHEKSPITQFEQNEPGATLRKLGFVQ
ncbi:MAG TPA: DoxX family protein [Candidatus Sulfopaludibacter sp.]|nr:DoxX family protein [Candidatus Sulfopaludibacter sp.]